MSDAPDLGPLLARATRFASNPIAAVVAMLRAVEDALGEVPDVWLSRIAERAGVAVHEVRAIAARAGVRRQKIAAEHTLAVCVGPTCSLRGSDALLRRACDALGLAGPGATADGRVLVEEVACLGACDFGPNLRVDGERVEGAGERAVARCVERLSPRKRRRFWIF
jgi:NADH:ubiquinone oxidoreductase subunit E